MIFICAWIKKNTVVVWLSLFKLTILLTEDDLSHFDRCVTACSINRLSFISSSSIRMKIDRSMTRLSTCCIGNLTFVTTCFFYIPLKRKNMIKRLINRPPTCQCYFFLIDFSSNFSSSFTFMFLLMRLWIDVLFLLLLLHFSLILSNGCYPWIQFIRVNKRVSSSNITYKMIRAREDYACHSV
jgi:hypothetical protein